MTTFRTVFISTLVYVPYNWFTMNLIVVKQSGACILNIEFNKPSYAYDYSDEPLSI